MYVEKNPYITVVDSKAIEKTTEISECPLAFKSVHHGTLSKALLQLCLSSENQGNMFFSLKGEDNRTLRNINQKQRKSE